jgi:hypothetical protein
VSEAENSPEFRSHVLEWLRRKHGIDAVSVDSVSGHSDCDEIVQGVCMDVFRVDVAFTWQHGLQETMEVKGSALGSLWQRVVELAAGPA